VEPGQFTEALGPLEIVVGMRHDVEREVRYAAPTDRGPCGSRRRRLPGNSPSDHAVVEHAGGDGGEVDGDGAIADAALLIENDMNR